MLSKLRTAYFGFFSGSTILVYLHMYIMLYLLFVNAGGNLLALILGYPRFYVVCIAYSSSGFFSSFFMWLNECEFVIFGPLDPSSIFINYIW